VKFKIKIPISSQKSGKYMPVVIVQIDEEGNEISEQYAVMQPDGSVGSERFLTLQAAEDECERLNNPKPD